MVRATLSIGVLLLAFVLSLLACPSMNKLHSTLAQPVDYCYNAQVFARLKAAMGCGDGDSCYDMSVDYYLDYKITVRDFNLFRSRYGTCITDTPTVTPSAHASSTPTEGASNTPQATNIPTEAPTNTPQAPSNTPNASRTSTIATTATRTATRTPTRSRTPTPTPPPASTGVPSLGGCQVFPADNYWNRNISAVPTHTSSDAYLASLGLGVTVHPDFGSGTWNGGPIGIPYTLSSSGQNVDVVIYQYPAQSDFGLAPIPTYTGVEGGLGSDGDRHATVIDTLTCNLYEMYHSYPQASGDWRAGSSARWSLASNTLRPNGWTSTDAAGLPVLPGLVRYAEALSGPLRHAVRVAMRTDGVRNTYTWPARHTDGGCTSADCPPMGTRLRLRQSVSISQYPAIVRNIMQGLRDYGIVIADTGSGQVSLSGEPHSQWNDSQLVSAFDDLDVGDFEVVDMGPLMVDVNSGQTR